MAKYKIGDILNFHWDNFYGKVIKVYNYVEYGYNKENRWTHSAIIGQITKGNAIVYEALANGFVKNTYSLEQLDRWVENGTMIVGRANYKLTKVKPNCDKYIGKPYGFLDIFNIGLYLIFKKFSFTISTKSRQLICSEAVARILYDSSNKNLNFEKEFDKRFDLIAPIDLRYSKQIDWNLSQKSKSVEK